MYIGGKGKPKPLYLSTDEDDEDFGTPFFIRDYVEVSEQFLLRAYHYCIASRLNY